jgi:D-amino peptidase
VGYHAASTQQDSILAHTYHGGAYRSISLNGELCSEGYLNAALAGEFGRPVILVAGDQHTLEDARRYAPRAVRFASKHSIGARSQMSRPPDAVNAQLKAAAEEALTMPLPQPFVLKGPFRLELEMTSHMSAEMLAYLPGVTRSSAWGVAATFDSLEAVMRFVSFAMLYSPTGATSI